MRKRLLALQDDIDRRARATIDTHAFWPCRRGCDTCCRRLADVPRLVRAEWELLREGLDALPQDIRAEVDARIAALSGARGPITCPMLDEEAGACRVYAHRPTACRTYGFYVERGIGLHCELVTEAVRAAEERGDEPVVWGNQESIEHALTRLAHEPSTPAPSSSDDPRRPITEWATPRT